MTYRGSIVALVTPMSASGDLDMGALDALVDWHVEQGTDAIVAVGTTGESPTLTPREHMDVVARVVAAARGRVPVIAGTGANATHEATSLTREALERGADAALLVTPYYNKPTQEGLYRHYSTVADAVDIPQILYNVPARTACDMSAATVARLASHERIIGIKESCGDPARVSAIRAIVAEDFFVLSGEDAQTLQMMRLGAVGTISVSANIAPAKMHRFCAAWLGGDEQDAICIDGDLQPLHAALFVESSPIPVKWALAEMGRIGPGIRLPLTPLAEAFHERLRAVLRTVGAS